VSDNDITCHFSLQERVVPYMVSATVLEKTDGYTIIPSISTYDPTRGAETGTTYSNDGISLVLDSSNKNKFDSFVIYALGVPYSVSLYFALDGPDEFADVRVDLISSDRDLIKFTRAYSDWFEGVDCVVVNSYQASCSGRVEKRRSLEDRGSCTGQIVVLADFEALDSSESQFFGFYGVLTDLKSGDRWLYPSVGTLV